MPPLTNPLLRRPLPLLSISTTTLLLATTLAPRTQGKPKMSTSPTPRTTPLPPRHATWPYTPADFARADPTPDASFYSSPRFVTHIDDAAIASLKAYYASALPRQCRVLDFCSSWVSHYPREIEAAVARGELRVVGMGMNEAELQANGVLGRGGRVLADLNESADVGGALRGAGVLAEGEEGEGEGGFFDAATCVVSVDYLTDPVGVLRSLRGVMREGARVHLAVSNRCFPTKAVARWLRVDEGERVRMVGDYLHFAGWRDVEVVELSDGRVEQEGGAEGGQNSLQGLMGWMGMRGRDPLWVVRAVK
ncbi:hypothetical protein WHR41_00073 [Cladosporium halotolerans]|uniref:S-adenosyl-L-methionine-dependent methyltransferase n=1 Tax=Cladosporium halotolerans TaxID=1052096 RepID=A0AB34L1A3_9PEZI